MHTTSHPIQRLQPQDVEGLPQHGSCGLAEKDPAHVDTDNLVRTWSLLNAIAVVVELSECGTEIVGIVAESVRGQVVKDTTDDLWEANQSLAKFEFFLMLQDDGGGLGSHLDLVGSQLCSASNGPEARQMRQKERGSVGLTSWKGCASLQQVLDAVCACTSLLT